MAFDYKSKEWVAARAAAVRRARWTCEGCGANVAGKFAARVDHRLTVRQHPELALHPANLRVLCTRCDAARHAEKGNRKVPRTEIGVDGFPK